MQVGYQLHFNCLDCSEEVRFSVLGGKDTSAQIVCSSCLKRYAFDEGILLQLQKFESLCRQIHESRDILGDTQVAVNVDDREVKIPYKLLLTRLSSVLQLQMAGRSVDIHFRLEPVKDVPEALSLKS